MSAKIEGVAPGHHKQRVGVFKCVDDNYNNNNTSSVI